MDRIAQRIRAIAIVGVLWGAAWSVVGAVIGLINWFRLPGAATDQLSIISWLFGATTPFIVLGAFCGAGFAVLLSGVERNHTVDDLDRRRMALWGAIAGMLCFVAYVWMKGSLATWVSHPGPMIGNLGVFAALGGVSSVGSLAIARRPSLPAQARQREIASTISP